MRVKPILPQNFVASVEIHVRYFFTAYVKFLSYRIVQCSIPDVRKRSFSLIVSLGNVPTAEVGCLSTKKKNKEQDQRVSVTPGGIT
jgi:hypothetical protein